MVQLFICYTENLILVGYKFLITNLNFGVNQYISGHVISQNVELLD